MDMSPPKAISHAQRRDIVIGVLVAMMLAALDQTIVAPALPTIGASLGDADFLAWIISVYLLTGTAVTPLYGKLSDIHGRRPAMSLALGIFMIGSIICALAPSMFVIIVGRAVQGLGGGGLVALAQTVIADVVSPRERSRYVVYISTVWATSSVAGPILGGFFAQHLSWTLIFWINLPLGVLAFVMTHTPAEGSAADPARPSPRHARRRADHQRDRRLHAGADAGRRASWLELADDPDFGGRRRCARSRA